VHKNTHSGHQKTPCGPTNGPKTPKTGQCFRTNTMRNYLLSCGECYSKKKNCTNIIL
jgi:hypothetical protein